MDIWLQQPILDGLQIKCCLGLVYCCKTQVSVHGKQLMSFVFRWQIFRTPPDATLPEPGPLSAPPNAPPRQSKRQGQRTKRPVAVYNLCLELEDGKMFLHFSSCLCPQGRPWFPILCVFSFLLPLRL